jgi:hypothetical protein
MTSSGAIAVVRRPRNDPKATVWNEHLQALEQPFVFTSSDVVPDACCPVDVVEHLAEHLRDNPRLVKAGLGLRIDDLPTRYAHRREVLVKQSEYWRVPAGHGVFLAPVDTTFALYRRGGPFAFEPAVRTGRPYLARHEPWYSDSANRTEEERYYAETIAPGRGSWGREQLPDWMHAACAKLAAAPRTLVHLASGADVFPGWINVDARPDVGADVVFDLERCADERLPIGRDSVDGFFMGDAFARLERTFPMLQELYRIAKPEARLAIRVRRDAARPLRPDAFDQYGQPGHPPAHDDYRADWQVECVTLVVGPGLADTRPAAEVAARMDGVREVAVELRAVKPPRPRDPGLGMTPTLRVSSSPVEAATAF